MAETNITDKKYLGYDGLRTVVDNVKEYTDSAVDQKSQVQIIESGETETLSTLEIYKMTQEEFDKAVEDGTIVENAIYLTPEEDIDLSQYSTIDQLNEKADKKHSHKITDINELQSTLDVINEDVSKKAELNHNHDISDVVDLRVELDNKAQVEHTHDYAESSHSHTSSDITDLQVKLDEKSDVTHTHDYAPSTHSHEISEITGLQDELNSKAESTHTHDYADSSHTHDDRYYTEEEIDVKVEELEQSISEKAEVSHSHTDVHYTKDEVDELLSQTSVVQFITWEVDD